MHNDDVLHDVETTPNASSGLPDPKKYDHERGECLHRHLLPSTAYSYGCRCRGCYKYHAAERYRRTTGPLPCAFPGCPNPRRRVQRARYCDDHTTCRDYRPTGPILIPIECAACGQLAPIHRDKRYKICPVCHNANAQLVRQATAHHLTQHALVKAMHNPTCQVCAKRIYVGSGGHKSGFAIDHDHTCCPGPKSCGSCVRGVLCSACNLSLGHVESMIEKAGSINALLGYMGAGS